MLPASASRVKHVPDARKLVTTMNLAQRHLTVLTVEKIVKI